jgi:tetraacyldisaccharide 4'-kinase
MKGILSNIFKIVVDKRNYNFDKRKNKVYKCITPVISVGNLSVGGAGKTPFVQYLVKYLKSINLNPGIVGKGYKRKSRGPKLVCDGEVILCDAKTGGDELFLLAENLNVPVIAHELKYIGALQLESMFDLDCIIVDDGYQHRMLYRDMDIVLLDTDTLDHPCLIPKGRLREPLENINRADVICFTGNIETSKYNIERYLNDKLIVKIIAEPGIPYLMDSQESLSKQQHLSLNSVSGIAKPENFHIMLKSLGHYVNDNMIFKDHHMYNYSDIKYIINKTKKDKIKYIATTEKDAVKLKEFGNVFAKSNIDIFVFPITLDIKEGKRDFEIIIKNLLTK